jgi:hypothetical protein
VANYVCLKTESENVDGRLIYDINKLSWHGACFYFIFLLHGSSYIDLHT